jgi:putative transposase
VRVVFFSTGSKFRSISWGAVRAGAPRTNYAIQVRQRAFKFPMWGGRRKGAGRPRKDGVVGARPGVAHVTREVLAERFPVHVTWRMDKQVWNLRARRCFGVMQRAMYAGALKGGFRLVHYAVMGNHVHLIVEAPNRVRLSRGMQGLGVRIARALNRVMARQGRVVADRYHAHILRTPSEVKRARHYLTTNAHHHYARGAGRDPYTSYAPVVAPRTWLLSRTIL